jgi:hypothetical protein
MDVPGSSSDDDKQTERVDDAERRREEEEIANGFCRFCSYLSLRPESVGRRRF